MATATLVSLKQRPASPAKVLHPCVSSACFQWPPHCHLHGQECPLTLQLHVLQSPLWLSCSWHRHTHASEAAFWQGSISLYQPLRVGRQPSLPTQQQICPPSPSSLRLPLPPTRLLLAALLPCSPRYAKLPDPTCINLLAVHAMVHGALQSQVCRAVPGMPGSPRYALQSQACPAVPGMPKTSNANLLEPA